MRFPTAAESRARAPRAGRGARTGAPRLLAALLLAAPGHGAVADPAWVARHAGAAGGDDQPTAVAVDRAGSTFVTGFSLGVGGYDAVVVRYAADGTETWSLRYDGPAGGYDEGTAIAVDAVGDAYVAGVSDGGETGQDLFVLKVAGASGEVLWVVRHDATVAAGAPCDAGLGCGADRALALALLDDGAVAVTGASRHPSRADSDYLSLRVGREGAVEWTARADGPAQGEDVASAVAADGCGNVYVTGRSDGGASVSAQTVAYDRRGTERWRRRYDGAGAGYDAGEFVGVDGAGNVYVVGTSHGEDGRPQIAALAYADDGTPRWEARHRTPAGVSQHLAGAAVDAAGRVHIAGSLGNVAGWRFLAARYAPDGTLDWYASYHAGGDGTDSVARAMAIDADGTVYVTGEIAMERRRRCEVCADYGTVAFDGGTGAERWAERFDGSASHRDRAHAVAIGAGSVTVTGRSVSRGSRDLGLGQPPRDIVTVRYARAGAAPAPATARCPR